MIGDLERALERMRAQVQELTQALSATRLIKAGPLTDAGGAGCVTTAYGVLDKRVQLFLEQMRDELGMPPAELPPEPYATPKDGER